MIKQFLSIHSSTSVQLNAKRESRQECFPLHCTLDWPHVGKVFSTICDLVPAQSCGHCNHCNHCNLCNHRGGSLLGVTATCLAGLAISSRRRCSSCSQAVCSTQHLSHHTFLTSHISHHLWEMEIFSVTSNGQTYFHISP